MYIDEYKLEKVYDRNLAVIFKGEKREVKIFL